jgi:hypothetical protein
MTRTISEQDLPKELERLRKVAPKHAEAFETLQRAMQQFGVTATLKVSKPDPSTTPTTRFSFSVQDNSPTDSEAQSTE